MIKEMCEIERKREKEKETELNDITTTGVNNGPTAVL
jgi:hypothetical protein